MSQQHIDLAGKTAVVTGASRGYGYCIASALAKAGARVALLARSEAALAAATKAIGDKALAISVDITDPQSVRRGFARVADSFGQLDFLINNAAAGRLLKIADATDDDLRAMVDVNFLGHVYCCREAIPLIRRAGGGAICNISSESTLISFPFLTMYAAAKSGLESFSTGLRAELQSEGIRVIMARVGTTRGVESSGPEPDLRSSAFSQGWDPELGAEAFEVWSKGGQLSFSQGSGGGMDPEAVAQSILPTLVSTGGVNVDIIQLRAL